MNPAIKTTGLSKSYGDVVALDSVNLEIDGPSIIGLLGKNGSGKTTLIRQIMGEHLPTGGNVETLGVPASGLGQNELSTMGYVPQEIRLLDWMTVAQHLRYVATFYPDWDERRQKRLLDEFELNDKKVIATLSKGNLQKIAIILAVCHHPGLLVLDEPVSDLDPIVRRRFLEFLLELVREDESTIIVSSHILVDIEKVVDRVICLKEGHLVTDSLLDDLKDSYTEWVVTSSNGPLPEVFDEPFILRQKTDGQQARLTVMTVVDEADGFSRDHHVDIIKRPLNLEEIFPFLVGE